jgi:hypothetical protein
MPRKATGKPNGRPPFEPTKDHRETVKAMVAFGIPYAEICLCITNPQTNAPIGTETLMKHFREEIDTAATRANSKVTESLFMNATGGGGQGNWRDANMTAAIWWTKCRMGWKETIREEHTGPDGKPIETVHVIERRIVTTENEISDARPIDAEVVRTIN